jgi:glycosyltransferase involved in cell wall biosynthesis
MRIGIYDPYLDTLSGGEKYILTAASCLSKSHYVTIFWDDPTILQEAQNKLNIDLVNVNTKPNIFSPNMSFFKKIPETAKYDCIILLSDGSIPTTLSQKTILHFQHPVEWVKTEDIKTKIKLKKINKVICNSYFTKKFIDKKFNINSIVLYPPCMSAVEVDHISITDIESKKKNIVLTVGRYSPLPDGNDMKKLEKMFSIFKKMVDNGLGNWEFITVVSFRKEYEKYILQFESSIKNYPIKIIKNANFNELKKIYLESKIYWHAAGFEEDTDKHPERAEHFGMTTVEAMAHKVVPVVFAAGGQLEIVENKITGYHWQEEAELIQKTKQLMIDDKLRIQMGNLALQKSKQFTTEKFCEELQNIIK